MVIVGGSAGIGADTAGTENVVATICPAPFSPTGTPQPL